MLTYRHAGTVLKIISEMPLTNLSQILQTTKKKSSCMRKETIQLINEGEIEKLFSIYRRRNMLIDLDRYKLVRNQVISAIRSDKVSETKAKLLSFKESNKTFYVHVRSEQKVHSHVAHYRK